MKETNESDLVGTATDEWHEPIDTRTIKDKTGHKLYRYVYGAGPDRFVNKNKICKSCPHRGTCYVGRHALVVACNGENNVA